MGVTLLLAMLVVLLSLGVGVAVGRRRGPIVGIATGFAVLAAMIIGFVVVLAFSLPM